MDGMMTSRRKVSRVIRRFPEVWPQLYVYSRKDPNGHFVKRQISLDEMFNVRVLRATNIFYLYLCLSR